MARKKIKKTKIIDDRRSGMTKQQWLTFTDWVAKQQQKQKNKEEAEKKKQ